MSNMGERVYRGELKVVLLFLIFIFMFLQTPEFSYSLTCGGINDGSECWSDLQCSGGEKCVPAGGGLCKCAKDDSGGGNPPPPPPPPPVCGDGSVNQGWEECDGGTSPCGVFASGCSSCICSYYNASLKNLAATTPCVSNEASSKQFTVSGRSQYCGNINITVNYQGQKQSFVVTGSTYSDYTFSHVFTIPGSVALPPSQQITVDINGNRNQIKNAKDGVTYDCSETLDLDLTYMNFFYCPDPEESINQNIFDFYDGSNYYTFYGGNTEYQWDECVSNQATTACASQPTYCVMTNGGQRAPNTAVNGDGEPEVEVCYSTAGIQGGWLDADVNGATCNLISGSKWFSCSNPSQCENAVDDFDSSPATGLCCGDDAVENVRETKSKINGQYVKNNNGTDKVYSACCLGGQTCVDEFGTCRGEGEDYCTSTGGVRATCTAGEWQLTLDDSCQSGCEVCDINQDGEVDNSDVNLCSSLNQLVCYTCGDNILQSEEACEEVNGNLQFNCAQYVHSTDPNNYTVYPRIDTCTTGFCSCQYETEPTCDLDVYSGPGACETDNDCSGNQVCNPGSCGCVDYIPGEELSVHVYDTDCSYRFCVSGDSTSSHSVEGYIETDTNFTTFSTQYFDSNDNVAITSGDSRLEFEINVEGGESCIVFDTDGKVETDFTYDGNDPSLATVYFEPSETHPAALPFEFSTSPTNTCRLCIPTQDTETILDDGLDNDCDGMFDEPEFDGYGAYLWEANCDYFMCVYGDDTQDYTTSGDVSGEGTFTRLRGTSWEAEDSYSLSTGNQSLSFNSELSSGVDCLIYNYDELASYNLELEGTGDREKIYLDQKKQNPFTEPFQYAAPQCAMSCALPEECGDPSVIGNINCGYEMCIFDCGGYWVDETSVWDLMFGNQNPGDYCETCVQNTQCSDYTNEESCYYDSCSAASTYFGCSWNETSQTCGDAFNECAPGETLCSDGTCSTDCEEIAGCIGSADGVCESGEGCACSDCLNQTASCTAGAVCGEDEFCGCPIGTALCSDGTCSAECEEKATCIGTPDGICQTGEGCACSDCYVTQDSCVEGAICSGITELCRDMAIGECQPGTTLCNDFTCDPTCEENGGKRGCTGEPNNICEFGEGCACSDCSSQKDSCAIGSICNTDTQLCEPSPENCIDSDGDGYFSPIECSTGNDCNDNSAAVHPGVAETCEDGVDNDCSGQIDDTCVSGVEISIQDQDPIRVFDLVEMRLLVKNNLNEDIDASVTTGLPADEVDRQSASLSLSAGETEEVTFNIFVKDVDVIPTVTLTIPEKSAEASQEIAYEIEIPRFIVAPDPEHLYGEEGCKDFYYVIYEPGEFDIEVNIINPEGLLSKTLFVDYISGVNVDNIFLGKINVPYCLGDRDFEIRGYLYKSTPGIVVDTVTSSITHVNDFKKEITVSVDVNKV